MRSYCASLLVIARARSTRAEQKIVIARALCDGQRRGDPQPRIVIEDRIVRSSKASPVNYDRRSGLPGWNDDKSTHMELWTDGTKNVAQRRNRRRSYAAASKRGQIDGLDSQPCKESDRRLTTARFIAKGCLSASYSVVAEHLVAAVNKPALPMTFARYPKAKEALGADLIKIFAAISVRRFRHRCRREQLKAR